MKYIFPIFLALFIMSCDNDDEYLEPTPGGGGGNNDPVESGFPDQYFQADLDGEPFLMQADHDELVMAGPIQHMLNCYYNYGMNISDATDPINEPLVTIMHYIYHFPPDCNDSTTFEGIWEPGAFEFSDVEGDDPSEGVYLSIKPANSTTDYSSKYGSQDNSTYTITEVIPLGDDYIQTFNSNGTFVGLKGTVTCTLYSPDLSDTIEVTNGEYYIMVQGLD